MGKDELAAFSLQRMTTPFEISDRFTEQYADLVPITATYLGITGRDHLIGDLSPELHGRLDDLYRAARADLSAHLDDPDPVQAFAAIVMSRWLDERIERFEAGEWRRNLNHIASPFQYLIDTFDVMPKGTAHEWANIVSRLEGFDSMLDGYRQCLAAGVGAMDTVAARQVEALLDQLDAAASKESRFLAFPESAEAAGVDRDPVAAAVDRAREACSLLAEWLRSDYLPHARSEDAVGRDEYLMGADKYLGMTVDPDETYEWGWSEVRRVMVDLERTAAEIDPEMSLTEVIELLETDPGRAAATREEFVDFISGIQEQAISQLSGAHFDVPEPLRTVTVSIAPPGGSLGAWYIGPTEDFSRPGSIWYAPGERELLPYWQEVSTAYHEGFPGHHLQVGTAVLERDKLSRFHRMAIWYSGAGEGWALYAERLMDELGFFEKAEYRLGLLASQLFRALRVVIDIGCHLKRPIPADAPLHPGDVWDYDRAVDYMTQIGSQPHDVAESEVTRYLGWWGQAISYKVGEREILDIRDQARRAGDLDLKHFHRTLLEAGAIRLDHLREVMS